MSEEINQTQLTPEQERELLHAGLRKEFVEQKERSQNAREQALQQLNASIAPVYTESQPSQPEE